MSKEIRAITPEEDKQWDDFVLRHPRGSVYHHSLWRQVLERSFGYQPLYLVLDNGAAKDFQGAYPFMLVKSMLTGTRLVSLPFSAFCAPLVPSSEIFDMISFSLWLHPEARYLESKLIEADDLLPDFLLKQSSYVTHLLDLSIGEQALFKSFHHTAIRQRITRAEKYDMKLRMGRSEEDLENFFRLHTHVRKRHGLPPHPYRFFVNMWKLMGPSQMMFLPFIEYEGQMASAAVVLKYKDTLSLEYAASEEQYINLGVNQLLIWELIKMACREGLTRFDFGRSALSNDTLMTYKDRWVAKRYPLNYYYYPATTKAGMEGSLWRELLGKANRMLPDALLQLEGKYLYRHLG